MKKRKPVDVRGIDAAAAALREFGRVWFERARADYKRAGEPYGPTSEGFGRWYRRVYGVIPNATARYP